MRLRGNKKGVSSIVIIPIIGAIIIVTAVGISLIVDPQVEGLVTKTFFLSEKIFGNQLLRNQCYFHGFDNDSTLVIGHREMGSGSMSNMFISFEVGQVFRIEAKQFKILRVDYQIPSITLEWVT